MKKLLKSFTAVVALTLVLNTSTFAQSNSNETANTTTGVDTEDDDNGKWGLLGLVGLLGLLGLKKNERTANYTTGNTPQNRS